MCREYLLLLISGFCIITTLPNYLLVQLEEPNVVPQMEGSGGMNDTLFKADVNQIAVHSFKRRAIAITSHIIVLIHFPAIEIFVLFLALPTKEYYAACTSPRDDLLGALSRKFQSKLANCSAHCRNAENPFTCTDDCLISDYVNLPWVSVQCRECMVTFGVCHETKCDNCAGENGFFRNRNCKECLKKNCATALSNCIGHQIAKILWNQIKGPIVC